MKTRPDLDINLDEKTFRSYYYLKSELEAFCRLSGLQAVGSKADLTNRIAHFLNTGEKLAAQTNHRAAPKYENISAESVIEDKFVCSEKHRDFFKETIGKSFTFNVAFQKWLKANAGKSYEDAVKAYYEIMKEKKETKTEIDKQFEYNTYIRDFFEDNKDKTLKEAIKCWKYKKSLPGHNKYERIDLSALNIAVIRTRGTDNGD